MGKLFTERQLTALNAFAESISEVVAQVKIDAIANGMPSDDISLEQGGKGARAYSEAIQTYLSFTFDRLLQQFSTLSVWSNNPAHELVVNSFGRQALPMTWGFGEVNPFCEAASWGKVHYFLSKAVDTLCEHPLQCLTGSSLLEDAQSQRLSSNRIVSTDPPYFDNIAYADLSDFFYVWVRRILQPAFPKTLATLTVPKMDELVASKYRHGGKEKAQEFFLTGMKQALSRISAQASKAFPITIYYAFKQSEKGDDSGVTSTGWEVFLEAMFQSGLSITATWPVRTEKPGRMTAQNTNALASSIVIVCEAKKPNQKSSRVANIADISGGPSGCS